MRDRNRAFLAAGWAVTFAAPHIYWATGQKAGLGTALSGDIVANAGTGMQLLNAAIAAFLLCGALTALSTLRAWPARWRQAARRVLVGLVWFGAVLLAARSVDIYVEFNLGLTGIERVPASQHDNYLHLARWFMFCYLPWFSLGAIAWTRLALAYTRAGVRRIADGAPRTANMSSPASNNEAPMTRNEAPGPPVAPSNQPTR